MNAKSPTLRTDLQKNKLLFNISEKLRYLKYPDHEPLSREIYNYFDGQSEQIESALIRLKENEPWEHISGQKVFHGHPFFVDNSVLIPRIETEILVDRAIADIHNFHSKLTGGQTLRVVDIGCGSGCVGVSTLLGVEVPSVDSLVYENTRFDFVDISKAALKISEKNAKNLLSKKQLQKVHFYQSNLIEKLSFQNDEYLIFLANLPYLADSEITELDPSVSNWEPHEALFGGGDDGLNLIRKFIGSTSLLNHPHKIYLEMDPKQIPIILEEIPQQYRKIEAFHDQYNRKRFLLLVL